MKYNFVKDAYHKNVTRDATLSKTILLSKLIGVNLTPANFILDVDLSLLFFPESVHLEFPVRICSK